jgi:hypothetical protein
LIIFPATFRLGIAQHRDGASTYYITTAEKSLQKNHEKIETIIIEEYV